MKAATNRTIRSINKQFQSLISGLPTRSFSLFAVVVIAGAVGTFLLVSSHAATPVSSVEPENGTLAAGATKVTDTTASGSGAAKFGSGATGGACPVSTPNVPGGADPWGGCFPGPGNTGIPAGTTLTAWTGGCTVTGNNIVIDSKTINCPNGIDLAGTNITIKNSKINGLVEVDTEDFPSRSASIIDSEVNGGNFDLAATGIGNLTILRANIYGGHNGMQCDEFSSACNIQDSWIHGQYQPPTGDSHLGGILSDGTKNFTIKHNSVFCDAPVNVDGGGCTGDVNLIPNFAAINGATITYNLMGANKDSSYCTYGGEKPPSPTPHSFNIVYQNNIFQRGVTGHCDAYGPVTDFKFTGAGNVWTNNKYDDGTLIVCTAADECM
jgi:hypothetical protein